MNTRHAYHTILLPTRPQPDTLIAIFLLKKFGREIFPGVERAEVHMSQIVPEGETEQTLKEKGIILIDLGAGKFDHHTPQEGTTASRLVAEYLDIQDNPALAKMLEYARRDDTFGKGTLSGDPLDRAFGLSGLIANLNRMHPHDSSRVADLIIPILEAHYEEELQRAEKLPREFQEKIQKNEAEAFEVRHRGKKIKCVLVASDNVSLTGYLRSQQGGRFDVVAQWLSSGHVNILTRPAKRIDLRSLVALVRTEEAAQAHEALDRELSGLARPGRMPEVPQWYYDRATNSLQNGGVVPKEVPPTKISKKNLRTLLELGLSEKIWSPVHRAFVERA